jgi:hypothetical protein
VGDGVGANRGVGTTGVGEVLGAEVGLGR